MPQNIIDLGFDVQAIQVQQTAVVTSLKQVYDYAVKLQDLKIGFNGSSTGVGDFKKLNDELKKSNDLLIQQAKLNNENAKAQLANAKAATELAKQQTEGSKQVAAAKLAEAKAETEATKQKEIETKTTITLTKEEERQAAAAQKKADIAARTARQEEKAVADLSNDYKQLSIAYNEAALRAKNLALQQGSNAPAAKAAAAEANALGAKLKEVDANVGQYGRNVGNYTNSIVAAFGKTFGFLRQAAAIIPGLGLSGIFLLIFEGITSVIEGLGLLGQKTETIEVAAKRLRDFSDSADSLKLSVKELNDELEFTKKLIDINNEIGFGKNARTDLKDMRSGVDNLTLEIFSLGNTANTAFSKANDAYENFTNTVAQNKDDLAAATLFGDPELAVDQLSDASKKAFDVYKKLRDTQFEIQAQQEAKIKERVILRRQIALQEEDIEKEAAQKSNEAFISSLKERLTALKIEAEDEIKFRQSIADSERFGEDERTVSQNRASSLRITLLKASAREEINEIQASLAYKIKYEKLASDEIADISHVAALKIINIKKQLNVDLVNEEIATNVKLAQISKKGDASAAEYKSAKDVADARFSAEKELNNKIEAATSARIKDEIEIIRSGNDAMLEVRQTQRVEEETALTDQYNKGLISEKNYRKGIAAIQKAAAIDALETTIKAGEAQLKILEAAGLAGTKQWVDLKNAIADAYKGLGDIKLKETLTNTEKLQKAFEKVAAVVQTISDLLVGAADIGYTKQANALKDLSDQQDINYEREVARISGSSLAEEEKANKLKILEAQHQAQIEANDRKQKKLDNDRAKWQKAATIANLIAQTALAVVKALPNIPLAIAAGAIGAAEIAIAIATPVPHYAKGTKNHSGGVALVGEGTSAEIVSIPGRAPFMVDEPTYLDLPKHSSVKPVSSDELNAVMHRGMLIATADQLATMAAAQSQREGEAKAIAVWQTNELKKAFGKNSKRPVVHVHNDLGSQIKFISWIDKNIKGKA